MLLGGLQFVSGDGSQTRSFQYVDDLVRGLIALMNSEYSGPVNIGNPDEYTVKDFAQVRMEPSGTSFSFSFFFPFIVSVACPTGPHPPPRLARRPNRSHICNRRSASMPPSVCSIIRCRNVGVWLWFRVTTV